MAETFSAADKLAAVRREIAFRRRVYPSWVERNKMTQAEADRQIAIMEAIGRDLHRSVVSERPAPAQRSLLPAVIDIKGPFPLIGDVDFRDVILCIVEAAQTSGEFPLRHAPPPDESAVIWIGNALDPIGFATFYQTYPRVAWLDTIWVKRSERGKGYGSLLLQGFEQACRVEGIKHAELGTDPTNHVMQRIARAQGWSVKVFGMEREL